MKIDIHNHTKLCNHAEGEMEDFVLTAIEKNIDVFGFSDHAPMHFDQKYRMSLEQSVLYKAEVLRLQEYYKNQIHILFGYEVDYLQGYILDEIITEKVDYFIGSVHFIQDWGFDNPEFIGKYQEKNIDTIWEEYFDAITQMAHYGKFDIVGHLDLIKVFKFLPKKEIRSIAAQAIAAIKKANMVVEINPAGYRKPICEQYPSRTLLEMCYESNIPITFGSDAHMVEHIDYFMDEAKAIAKSIGYSHCVVFSQRDRKLVNF